MNQVTGANPSTQALAAIQDYFSRQGHLNGVDASLIANGNSFAAVPTVHQTLHDAVQHSSQFLSDYVNFELVTDISGQKIYLDDDGLIITSTTNIDREGIDPTTLNDKGYQCLTNNFDILLPWSKLNQWAKFPDFQVRLRSFLMRRQALDHIKIGFNGTSHAAKSDRVANPLGEDVNIGWLETIRAEAPAHAKAAGNTFGADEFFKNIDAMVFSAKNELVGEVHRERGDLVVILGSALQNDKYFKVMNVGDLVPSEHAHRDIVVSQKRIGAMEAVSVPHFPADTFLITPRKNLSVYVQESSRRGKFEEQHASSGYTNWFTQNTDYVVEDLDATALVENISEVAPA